MADEWTDDEIEAAALSLARRYMETRDLRPVTEKRVRDVIRRNDCGLLPNFLDDARTALSAAKRVPDGHWLAPDVPTPEMIDAGKVNYFESTFHDSRKEVVLGSWDAMRDAYRRK